MVVYNVAERPTLRYVKYLGNKKIKNKKLAEETGLAPGDSLDPYSVEDGARRIEDYYHERGYSKVRVTILEGTKLTDKGAVYEIHEGPRQRIGKIVFVGNTIVSAARLKTVIESKKPILWIWKGYADKDVIEADVDKLTAYYRGLGFFQADISREIVFDDEGEWATLSFAIDEAPRYAINSVQFFGVHKFNQEVLKADTELVPGQPFDQGALTQAIAAIEERYGGNGYVFVDIKPETIFFEQPGKLDLVFNIDEGPRAIVGNIDVVIEGESPHTKHTPVLNRLSLHPGDILDIRELRDSERRLRASGLFANNPATGQMPPQITFSLPGPQGIAKNRLPRGRPVRGAGTCGARALMTIPAGSTCAAIKTRSQGRFGGWPIRWIRYVDPRGRVDRRRRTMW